MTNREGFEALMTDGGKWPRAVERNGDGNYLLMQTGIRVADLVRCCGRGARAVQAGDTRHEGQERREQRRARLADAGDARRLHRGT